MESPDLLSSEESFWNEQKDRPVESVVDIPLIARSLAPKCSREAVY